MDLPLIMISMANAASKPRGADIIAGMRGQIGIINSKDDIEIFLCSPMVTGDPAW
jgi:hypothetical protein